MSNDLTIRIRNGIRSMMSNKLLIINPVDLEFPLELKKQISCSLCLRNKTDCYVAFTVKPTDPKKYVVRPNTGVVHPSSSSQVLVTMQAQKSAPPDGLCRDNFLLQCFVTSPRATVTHEMFSKEARHGVEETVLKGVYVGRLGRRPRQPSPLRELPETPLAQAKLLESVLYSEELKQRKDKEVAVAKGKDKFGITKNEQEAKEWEHAYFEELNRRKETEMELKKERETLEKMRYVSENRITESYVLVQKLQDKYNLATKALRKAKEERDGLINERRIALIEVEELKRISRSDDQREAPQYFICPILLEVMDDPQLAADGFTYEAEAISSWLERGHETSPMTNMELLHTMLVPNLALRSAIQEWLQASSSSAK